MSTKKRPFVIPENELSKLINEVLVTANRFHGMQQQRERVGRVIKSYLSSEKASEVRAVKETVLSEEKVKTDLFSNRKPRPIKRREFQ